MDIHPETLAHARLAMNQAIARHLFDPNVSLIDFGFPEHDGRLYADELAIRIHVRKKMSGAALESAVMGRVTYLIPEKYGEFQTDVPQSAIRVHQAWAYPPRSRNLNPRQRRCDPLMGGISISNQYQLGAGTLGGMVVDCHTGELMILSNWHVLVGSWRALRGQKIFQPGRLDGGSFVDNIAALSRDAMGMNLDAAVAALNDQRRYVNDQYQLGPATGLQHARLGMGVVKSGYRTAVTYGIVAAVEGIAKLRYDGLDRVIRHVFTIESEYQFEQVSGPGDSGSIWLEEDTLAAVGLHFAGSDAPERALAMDLQPVLNALDVELLSAHTRLPTLTARQPIENEMELA